MNDENFQRQMDFFLQQQAKFDQNMIIIEEKTRQNTEDITRLVGALMNLTLHVQENSRQIAELTQHSKETDARFKETDARINALISMAERYFSGRNGT